MADCVDLSQDKIDAVVALGRKKAERDYINSKLYPITMVMDDERFGVCHWCESPIIPGHLFCERDPLDEGKCCSEMYDHEQKRYKELGL